MKKASMYDRLRDAPHVAGALQALQRRPRRWLVTGGAGFIGSFLTEVLLSAEQEVMVLDDFSTGQQANLAAALETLPLSAASRLEVVRGDVRDASTLDTLVGRSDIVAHHASRPGVRRSLRDPNGTHDVHVNGFQALLDAVKRHDVRLLYAASSVSYGTASGFANREEEEGAPLSPYAAQKAANDLYAAAYRHAYGTRVIGLRHFNVIGPRAPLNGDAGVLTRWMQRTVMGQPCEVYGDGRSTRDFVHVGNAVAANVLAATTRNDAAFGRVFNVGSGRATTLLELHGHLTNAWHAAQMAGHITPPRFLPFRNGDVRHASADVRSARDALGYLPVLGLEEAVADALTWFDAQATSPSTTHLQMARQAASPP
jgi:UDP-N-acetylglucosamine 4-epimerase